MNSDKSKIELSSNLILEFNETVKINNSNISKYKVSSDNSENVSVNSNDYYIYIESNIDENNLDKNKLTEYINNSISSNPNESNIYIDSINQFFNSESLKDQDSSDIVSHSGGGGADSTSNSYGKRRLEFFNPDVSNNGISLIDSEKLEEACNTINTASTCISGIENLLNRMRGFHLNLNNSYSSFKNGINDIGLELARITQWHSIDSVVDLYKDSFEKIDRNIQLAILADLETRKSLGKLVLPDELREAAGDKDYKSMQEEYLKEIDLLIADLTPNENGEINIKSVNEAYKRLSSIQQRFITSSKEEILIILDSSIQSADDIKDVNLTAEQKQAQYEQIVKNRDYLYTALDSSTIGGMDRATFDSLLLQDKDKLAGMLANAAALEAVSAFKGTEIDAKNTYNGVLNASINDMRDAYYASSIGQERLLGYFNEQYSGINDEYNAIGNTEYIKFCISNNRQYSWLKPELRGIADTINRINNYDKFSSARELDVNDPNDAEIIKQIENYKNSNYNQTIQYGYEERNGKYYVREYTSLGQQLLYHMDYHYAENTWNNGENRFITAFSNQGYVDAIERGYKNTWIENRIGNKVASLGKNTDAYKNAERDYYILSGDIPDSKRKKELQKEGELSFSDLVKCVNMAGGELKNLLDQEYVEAHKDEFAEILDSNSLWNIKAELFSKNPFLYGMDTLGNSAVVALNEAIVGLSKFGENVIDAVNTAVHSDLFLSEFRTVDSEGNIVVDLSELDDLHRELYETCWKNYKSNGQYDKDFQKFVDSNYGKSLSEMIFNQEYLKDSGIYVINGKSYTDYSQIPSSIIEQCMSDCSIKAFEYEKVKEWNVLDSSSSNQYMAAFKLGIRNGGDFSYLDNNVSSAIKEAAAKQFQTQLDVEVDKVGSFVQENIYSNEQYRFIEDNSFVKHDNILGMVFNQVGNMAVPIAISMIPALAPSALGAAAPVFQKLSSAALFTSAFGGAAEEAFNSGASYNEALKYATYSAATELAIEHVFSGIGGYGEGWLDDALEYLPNKYFASKGLDTNLTAQKFKTLITGGLGEAVEEVTTDFVTPLWQSMTYMNEKSYGEIVKENVSLESLAQTALVSFLSSMIFKGVEINQQTSTFNKNLINLQNRISTISDINLDTDVLKTQAKKVLAEYIGGIIENEGVIKSGLLEQLIKNTSNQLVSDPKSREQLSKLQDELTSFKNQNVTLGEGKNSINLTGSELLKLEDFTGFDGKYSVEDGKIKFENEQTQNKFNNSVLELAQTQADSYNVSLKELISEFENSREKSNTKNLQDAINSVIQYGNIEGADLTDVALFEYGDSMVVIPKAIAQKVSTKLSIEDGKITFKKDMTSSKFIDALYKKAINLCNDQIGKTSYDIKKAVDNGLINKAIDIIKPSLESQIANVLVTNVTHGLEKNLTKIDVETTINGEQRNISVYVDGNTDSSVYKQADKLTELIQKTLVKNENSNLNNVYLGELVYDSKEKTIDSVQNKNNQLYVNSLELENAKKNGSIHSLQSAIFTLIKNSNELVNSSFVKITHDGVTVVIPESILKEITNKYKIIDGNVKFNQDLNIDKFMSEVYNKALDINKQTMEAIENTIVKNSTYVDTDGIDLYRLEVETLINGETKTVNVYVDANSDITSFEDSSKISEKLYQIISQNKNSENIYAGQIVYDEKTGTINVTENTANKLYVDSINVMSETNEHSELVTNEEVNETTNVEVTPGEEIKKGESYEYTIEEVKGDNSNVTQKDQTETVTNENHTKVGSESVITNVAQAASVGVTASATSQAIYQNNGEVTTINTESQTKDKNVQSNIQNKENIHVETSNNNVINISEIKSQVNSYIDSIKTECEKFIEIHQNDENFVHRFEQFKKDKIVQLNDKLAEIIKAITDSNSAELNNINSKIDSLSENDSLRSELISQRDKIIERQQQEISELENIAREKLQKVFSELNIEEKAEPLILTKDFVSTLTIEQKEFLAQISTEQGLIEYLQNNSLTNLEILNSSELVNSNNKYINKLIELMNETKGTSKQIYNVMEVVKNNSNPVFIESTYKGDTHTLSTNEVLDFMKTGKVDTKYSYSDYVNATNTLMSDLSSQKATIEISEEAKNIMNTQEELKPRMGSNIYNNVHDAIVSKVPLPKSINGIDSEVVYRYLTNQQLLQDLANNRIIVENKTNLISALKTILMMKEQLGINVDNASINIVETMYRNNIQNISLENLGTNVSKVYSEYIKVLNQCRGNIDSAIVELESMNYTNKSIAKAILTQASSNAYNYEYSRKLYDKSYDYLVSRGYTELQAAEYVGTAYREILDSRGYDTLISQDGIKIHVQKGICWYNQAYTLNYIQSELENIRKMYKTNIPVEVYVYDTFNPHDKYWSIKYKEKNFKSAATGGNGVIKIYTNSRISATTLSHEYGHLLDTQIMKDKKSFGRVSESQEYLDAIASDNSVPTAYSTKSCHEDFAESIAHMRQNPVAFKNKFPNRYQVLSKYINVESSVSIANGSLISNNMNVYEELNGIFKTLNAKYGTNDAIRVLMQYVETRNLNVITRTDNARGKIANIDVRYIEKYLESNFNIRFANTENQISNNIKNSLDAVYRTLEQKYGKGEAIKVLTEYVKTGNINVITRTNNARGIISNTSMDDVIKYVNSRNNLYSPISSNISEPSIIIDSDMDFVDANELSKTTEINIEDVMSNMNNSSSLTIPSTFNIVIDGKVETTLNLKELVSNGPKISTCYELMEESQYGEFNSTIVDYIDYIRENNISVDIDSNVMKFYESYKYAKENNVFIVNEDRILEKGADMIAIPQEIYNKCQNDLIYQEIVDTIIESVQSLDNFEKFISMHYLSNDMYMIYMNDVINCIEPSIKANENFKIIYNVISKLNEYAIKDFGLFLYNTHEMICENANPIYLPYYINGEFRNGHQTISTNILIDTILGKNQFPSSYNANITENCRILYNYLQSNNITLNENIMEKLEFVKSLNEDQIILNASEYFEGKSPIVTTEFIKIQDAQISSLDIMEILKMDSDKYIKLLRDDICEFKDIKSDNLILSIQRLLSQNQTLREQYNENYIKLKDLYDNSYVLKNTLTIVPKMFNGYYTSLIDTILNNPNFINSYNVSEKQNLINVINDFIEYLKSNNVDIEYHRYEKVLEFLNRNVPNIDSSIAIKGDISVAFENSERNGGSFGALQGVIEELFKKVNMNTVIERLFGNELETKKLLEELNKMNISDEEFTRQLLKSNRGFLFTKNTTEIKMVEDLVNQVMKNYPGMSKKEAIQFLYLMETTEAGGRGICNYASMVNLIFDKYLSNPTLFEKELGYPMYVKVNGKKQLNTSALLVDLYSIINENVLVAKENGIYNIATNNENYLNMTNSTDGTIVMEYFKKFLDKKGINMDISKAFSYNSDIDLMHYEELITNIHDALARGEHIHVTAWNFDICRPNGSIAGMDVGGHIMSVLEITKDGHLIVDSWGKRFMIDLKFQMSKTGNFRSSSKICVVTYDISFDNNSNVSAGLDINTDVNNERNTHNSAHIEVFDVPSDSIKSNVTSIEITDEDLKFIDEGINTKGIEATMASAQNMQSNLDSVVSNTVINIDGVEITVETLKELQTSSNIETALKAGEYASVRVEKALVELSKLEGITLDSKLQEIVRISESLKPGEIIFNIEDVYTKNAEPLILTETFASTLTTSEVNFLKQISTENGLIKYLECNPLLRPNVLNNIELLNNNNKYVKQLLELSKDNNLTSECRLCNVMEVIKYNKEPIIALNEREKHLIMGDGYSYKGGILGIHSSQYFNDLCEEVLGDVYDFYRAGRRGKIINSIFDIEIGPKRYHPYIDGVYDIEIIFYTINNNGKIKCNKILKTLCEDMGKLLESQREIVNLNNSSNILGSPQGTRIGIASNGLFFTYYPNQNQANPFIDLDKMKFDLLLGNDTNIQLKVPVKNNGGLVWVDVNVELSKDSTKNITSDMKEKIRTTIFRSGPKLIEMVETEINEKGYNTGDVINVELSLNELECNTKVEVALPITINGIRIKVLANINESLWNDLYDSNGSLNLSKYRTLIDYAEVIIKEKGYTIGDVIQMNELDYNSISNIMDMYIDIDGVKLNLDILKQLQTPNNLETALKTGEYAGVRVERALVELSKLDGVTLDSKLQELVKISETLKENEVIFNIEDAYSNGLLPNTINIDVYNEFIRSNPNSNISIDDLYEIINSNSVIYRLISNDTIIKNVSNESIKESFEYLVSIANRYNYENKVIREAQYLLDLMNDNYTTDELYDAFAIVHTEFNTPDVYYECYDYLKTMDVDSAVKLLESKGYTTLDITDAFLNVAIRGNSQTYSKHFYYRAFDYLVENGMDEKEAATTIRDKYRTLLYRRGTRVVSTTPNGVKIRIVNNISTNNKLFTIEKIESMIKQAEKYYSKTGLKEIVIFDSFAPHNIYSEKVQYEDYVKTHNNRRFVAAASATKSSIILWEDFDQLDSIVHEYGHTIDKHIQSANNLSTVFSSSSIWLEAIQKDTSITSKRVSEYAYATNGEDFAEFLKYFNRNSLEVARKYPNRYKAASKYLNLDIDSNIIERYLDSKKFFIEGIEDLSNLLTEDGSMLEFIKQYLFENLKGDNSISKTVISELDAIYESRIEIIEDYGLYSLFMDMREQERIDSNEFLKIIKVYLDGKDISSKFKDARNLEIIELLEKEEIQEWYEEELNEMTAETEKIGVSDEEFEKMMNSLFNDLESNSSSDTSIIKDEESTYNDSLIEDADVDMALPKKSIFSKKIETVSVSDIPRVFRNMNTSDIISILEGKTTLKNDENFINNKKSIIRFVKYLSENNIKLSLNERANTIIENLRNGDFRLNILNFSDVLNGDTPIYGPSSINLDGIRVSTDDVMVYLENKKNEISSIITSDTPNQDARDLLNAIDELGSKNDIIYDKYRKSIKLIERIERSYVYRSYDSYYLLPMSFNGIDTSNILNSDLMSLTSYINSLSNADKKAYRVALDEFGKYIYKSNTRLSKQDLSRVNKLYDVINTKKFSTDTVIKSTVYDTFEMSYQNDGEFGSNQGKVREVIEKLGITNVIESLFDEKVERSKFLQTLSEFNISERDFITALNKRTQREIMNNLFKEGDINLELYSSLVKQVKINYPNMSTMEAVRFLYLIETKEAGGPGICNNPILVNMIFDRYVGRETIFERDFGYPMYINSNSGKKVLNEARLLVDIFSTLNDGVLVHNVNGNYAINTTSENYVRAYDLNGLRLDAIEKFINKKGINLNVSKSYFFNSNEELMHYDYLMEQIKSELDKGNYVILGARGFDMDVENFEFREDIGAHGMTVVGIDMTGELILDSWGMKARVDLKKELSRASQLFKNRSNNMIERIFTISSYNIS